MLCLNKDRLCKFSLLERPWDDDDDDAGGGSIPTATVWVSSWHLEGRA